MGKCWAYLAVVLDLFSRKPVGLGDVDVAGPGTHGQSVADGLGELRGRPTGVMFHSDQGSPYTSRQYWPGSMALSDKAEYESVGQLLGYNAPMERFFRSLKTECVPTEGYNSFGVAQSEIIHYITGAITASSGLTGITAV